VIDNVSFCGIPISTLAGIGLGIAAIRQKAQSKVFGILSIVFNTLILMGFCVLIIVIVLIGIGLGMF
jgi:uncharacterized membrane protein YqjE